MARETRETLRKLIHISFGGLAFSVVYLGPAGSALLVLAAVLFNAIVLPWFGGRRLWRPDEKARGFSVGIVSYPVSVLFLILIFWRRPEVAASAWGILAFGDGFATLVGARYGRVRLPWNRRKSWVGLVSYSLFGAVAATFLLGWARIYQDPLAVVGWPFLVVVAAVVSLLSAFLESQPQGLDDNVGVPILTGLLLFGLLSTEGYWILAFESGPFLMALAQGLAINLIFGLAAFAARSIDGLGVVAGTVLGTVIYVFLGFQGLLLLGTFFVLGTAATRLGYRQKSAGQLAQEAGGRRGARHAIANASVPAFLALLAVATAQGDLYLFAFAGAFAAAASDTLESEIGQLWGGTPMLVTTLRPVPRGTDGAVSLVGSLAGVVGAAILAVLGWSVGFYPPAGIALVTMGGFLGSAFDSLLGATLERWGLLDNEAVNALSTLAGALATLGLAAVFT